MYKLYTGLLPEALNELYIKNIKIHSLKNVSARIWNVITTNINVNISFMQFKIVLKLYLHENEVILKYNK